MLFDSMEFIIYFLPIVILLYTAISKFDKLKKTLLIVLSLIFYCWITPKFVQIISVSIFVNYCFALNILKFNRNNKGNISKILTILAVIFNILILCYFKYLDFFIDIINTTFSISLPIMKLILPLGISFWTFQQISFIVDTYSKKIKDLSILDYVLYVLYFPKLISGPITRFDFFISQFNKKNNNNFEYLTLGFYLFTIGLLKKVFFAQWFSQYVTQGYNNIGSLSIIESWILIFSFAFQIYFDFSGYTDMAIGVSKMLNIDLPINFNSPYKATSLQDFWRRWHITLSLFLRDYVYIPLGGSRCSDFRIYLNLLITFLICGIWHGPSFMYIAWGMLNGFGICVNRIWKNISNKYIERLTGYQISLYRNFCIIITFITVSILWVFFNSNNFDDAFKIINAAFCPTNFYIPKISHLNIYFANNRDIYNNILLIFPLAFTIIFLIKNSNEIVKSIKPNLVNRIIFGLVFYITIFTAFTSKMQEFIYFKF